MPTTRDLKKPPPAPEDQVGKMTWQKLFDQGLIARSGARTWASCLTAPVLSITEEEKDS